MRLFAVSILLQFLQSEAFVALTNDRDSSCSILLAHERAEASGPLSRRKALTQSAWLFLGATALLSPRSSYAATGANDGNLPELPSEAVRSYLQYRQALQTSTDFYLFDMFDTLKDPSDWGAIGELFAGKPTRIEREFTNVMRVIGLSMPPDEADEMREAQYEFEKAMGELVSANRFLALL